MKIKNIVAGTRSDYDTAIMEDGLQIVIVRGQNDFIGKEVTIAKGICKEVNPVVQGKKFK